MQWYFLSETQEQVPVHEEHIAGLVQTGVIRSNTMIWKEGMAQWVACSEIKPELFAHRHVVPVVGAAATARQTAAIRTQGAPQAVPAGMHSAAATAGMQLRDGQIVREAAAAFASGAGWMKFLGALFLIAGIAYILFALFVVVAGGSADDGLMPGLVIGVITTTVGGILMWMGMLLFQSAGKAQEAAQTAQKYALLSALHQNAKFFKIGGISAVVVAIVYGIVIALFFSFFASMIAGSAVTGNFGGPPELEMMQAEDDSDPTDRDGFDDTDSANADDDGDEDAAEIEVDADSN